MELSSALAGVISSVEILSPAFRLTWAFKKLPGGVLIGKGLILGPRTIEISLVSMRGVMNIESSTGYTLGSLTLLKSSTFSITSSGEVIYPVTAVAAATSGLTR